MNTLIRRSITAGVFCTFLFSSATPVSAAVTYTYDANGNMTSDEINCYEYNDANQLKKVKRCSDNQVIAEYVYDYQGNRMVKKTYINGTLSNTVNSWSDSFETKVASGGATETTNYYFANGELVAKKNNDGTKQYIQGDHLGSSSVITNQTGSLVESTSYDPWGKIRSGGAQSKFAYTGQEHDSETGLDYYNARYYSTDIRRFTQPDTYTANIYNPQDLNVYSYVLNNPLRYTDPTGHYAETGFDIISFSVSVNDLQNDPTNPWNWVALGGDAVGTALPGVGGVGLGVKVIENGGDVASVAKRIEKTIEKMQSGASSLQKTAKEYGVSVEAIKSYELMKTEKGKIIAGGNSKTVFRDADKIVKQYGGQPTEWVKKTSTSSYKDKNGASVQAHWVENTKTGKRVEYKPKIQYKKK